jgi:hypothetical protein
MKEQHYNSCKVAIKTKSKNARINKIILIYHKLIIRNRTHRNNPLEDVKNKLKRDNNNIKFKLLY